MITDNDTRENPGWIQDWVHDISTESQGILSVKVQSKPGPT